jgi:hypothetical protein
MRRAHNLGLSEMAPLALTGTSLRTWAGSRLCTWLLLFEGSRVNAELIANMTLTSQSRIMESPVEYLNDG